MTTLMRNGRDRRSGKPASCHARKERVLLVGTRSADHIRASGHSGRIQRPHTWLHPNVSLRCPIFPLHRGRRPYMALSGSASVHSRMSAVGANADVDLPPAPECTDAHDPKRASLSIPRYGFEPFQTTPFAAMSANPAGHRAAPRRYQF